MPAFGYVLNPIYPFQMIAYQLVNKGLCSTLLTKFKIGLVTVQSFLSCNLQNLLLYFMGDEELSASFATHPFHGHKPVPSQMMGKWSEP
jgi:hypothetical protein